MQRSIQRGVHGGWVVLAAAVCLALGALSFANKRSEREAPRDDAARGQLLARAERKLLEKDFETARRLAATSALESFAPLRRAEAERAARVLALGSLRDRTWRRSVRASPFSECGVVRDPVDDALSNLEDFSKRHPDNVDLERARWEASAWVDGRSPSPAIAALAEESPWYKPRERGLPKDGLVAMRRLRGAGHLEGDPFAYAALGAFENAHGSAFAALEARRKCEALGESADVCGGEPARSRHLGFAPSDVLMVLAGLGSFGLMMRWMFRAKVRAKLRRWLIGCQLALGSTLVAAPLFSSEHAFEAALPLMATSLVTFLVLFWFQRVQATLVWPSGLASDIAGAEDLGTPVLARTARIRHAFVVYPTEPSPDGARRVLGRVLPVHGLLSAFGIVVMMMGMFGLLLGGAALFGLHLQYEQPPRMLSASRYYGDG